MENEIILFTAQFGLPVIILSFIAIALLGILKLCRVFSKLQSKNIKKFIYYAIDIILGFGLAALYFVIFGKNFVDYLGFSCTLIGAITAVYALYENIGARNLWQKVLAAIATWFKSSKDSKFKKLALKMGLDKALTELQTVVKEEADKAQAAQQTAQKITIE